MWHKAGFSWETFKKIIEASRHGEQVCCTSRGYLEVEMHDKNKEQTSRGYLEVAMHDKNKEHEWEPVGC